MRAPLPPEFRSIPLAHRGYHDRAQGCIENSLAAFRAAVAAGYGIEMDVLLSKDGVVMVFHDDYLERLTEATGFVADRPAAELGRIRLRDSLETIPTLAEALAVIAGRAPVLIELKDPTHAMTQTDGTLEAATARVVNGYKGPVAVMSFNPHSVAHMAAFAPGIARGITVAGDDPGGWAPVSREGYLPIMAVPDYDRCQASFISHGLVDLDRPRVHALKAAGAAILCWTVRSPEMEAQARRIADNITFEGYVAPLPA